MNGIEHRTYQPHLTLPAGAWMAPPSVDAYHDAWVDAAIEGRLAYRAWCEAVGGRRAEMFAVYVAAEQREQAAAETFARAVAASR